MGQLTVQLDEETHQILFDIQNKRRKSKEQPTAINKIASEFLTRLLKDYKKENPEK